MVMGMVMMDMHGSWCVVCGNVLLCALLLPFLQRGTYLGVCLLSPFCGQILSTKRFKYFYQAVCKTNTRRRVGYLSALTRSLDNMVLLCLASSWRPQAISREKNACSGLGRLPKDKRKTMAEWNPQSLSMDNSPAHSRYSEQLQLQHSYHVSPEPTIHHQKQEDNTSEDEDEPRRSSHSQP
jgi:hypothetical protein